MRTLALLIAILLYSPVTLSQSGFVKVMAPPQLDTLLKISLNNPNLQPIEGFRIQIFMESGNAAVERAQAAIARYQEAFPEDRTYLSFGQPYYRVRVGDFRTRLEAEGKLQQVSRLFGQAFVIKDIIDPSSLPLFINQSQQP